MKVPSYLVNVLFDPVHCGEMSVVCFASGSGTNFREAVHESDTPGSNFSVNLLMTDKDVKSGKVIGAIGYAETFGITHRTVNGYNICGSWKDASRTAEGIAAYERKVQLFNAEMMREIREFEKASGIGFDFAVLAGYMRLFRGPVLRRFNMRSINIHPAALGVKNPYGLRKYTGENAVYDALVAGEQRTRSSVIMLDPEIDAGAILVSGPWVGYEGGNVTQDSAVNHQEKQKKGSDWPSLKFALRGIANGKFGLHRSKFHADGNPVVVYDGEELPYIGYDLS